MRTITISPPARAPQPEDRLNGLRLLRVLNASHIFCWLENPTSLALASPFAIPPLPAIMLYSQALAEMLGSIDFCRAILPKTPLPAWVAWRSPVFGLTEGLFAAWRHEDAVAEIEHPVTGEHCRIDAKDIRAVLPLPLEILERQASKTTSTTPD